MSKDGDCDEMCWYKAEREWRNFVVRDDMKTLKTTWDLT